MTRLAHHFEEGGWGMFPIVVCSIVMLAAALHAIAKLWARRPDAERLLVAIERALRSGDLDTAVLTALASGGASGRIATRVLVEGLAARGRAESAAAAALLDELPPLAVGQRTLRATAQLATLWGLYGTVTGLYCGFCTVASADATSRAQMLARGLGEAMNCNAFGLFVSIVSIFFAWIVHERSERLQHELALVARAVANLVVSHRAELRWHGARAALDRPTYRVAA